MKPLYESEKGDSILGAVNKAIQFAKDNRQPISFRFNNIEIEVAPESYRHDIIAIYFLKSAAAQTTVSYPSEDFGCIGDRS